jgi:YesN/AraC family two-component response regulator
VPVVDVKPPDWLTIPSEAGKLEHVRNLIAESAALHHQDLRRPSRRDKPDLPPDLIAMVIAAWDGMQEVIARPIRKVVQQRKIPKPAHVDSPAVRERQKAKVLAHRRTARAETYLQEHLSEPITCGLVAKHVGISYSLMSRLFTQRWAMSVAQRLHQLRIEHARRT